MKYYRAAAITLLLASGGSFAAERPTPFFGFPFPIPGYIEAENFDRGGEGLGYHDNTPVNQGVQYRLEEGVDLFVSDDRFGGDYVVRFFEDGEWLGYTIQAPRSGDYDIELRVVTHPDFPDSAFHVEVDGVNVTGPVVLPQTGAVSNYQWLGRTTIPLAAGKRFLKIVSDRQFFDINALRITDPAVRFSCSFENAPADCGFIEQAKARPARRRGHGDGGRHGNEGGRGDPATDDDDVADRGPDLSEQAEDRPRGRARLRSVARDGRRSVRLHTRPGDTDVAGSGAAERNDLFLPSIATDCFEGQEQWWAHSVLFPNDYVVPPPGGFGVVFDFHHTGSFGQANFHVDAASDGLRLRGYGGETVNTGENSVGQYLSEPLGEVERDIWYDFVYHVRWSSFPDGYFIAWLRKGPEPIARKVLEHHGPTLYRGLGCFLKLANYHTALGQPSSVIHDRVLRGTSADAVSLTPLEP